MGQWCKHIYGLANTEHWKWSSKRPPYGRAQKRPSKRQRVDPAQVVPGFDRWQQRSARNSDEGSEESDEETNTDRAMIFHRQGVPTRKGSYKQIVGDKKWKQIVKLRSQLELDNLTVTEFVSDYVGSLRESPEVARELKGMLADTTPPELFSAESAAAYLKIDWLQGL
jgi:hypothetical protein